ncbi:hypothetical protein P8452_37029 [Trifolium repens]|nr:hypothetical protein P8452_37029 [Trifolium repens]
MLENMEKKVEAVRLVVYKGETKTLMPDELVELILKYSNITQLWKDKKYLPNLRRLDLSHSKNLRKMPDFRDFPNLEQLNFQGCVKLVEMDPSIGVLRKLVSLNLKDCKKLVSIPNNIFGLSSLECLNLSGCPKLVKNPSHMNISEKSSHSQSTTSPILKWTTLCYHSLYPDTQKDLASCVVPSLLSLSNLLKLDISFYGLSQLLDEIGCLRWLQELNLGGNNFVTLPNLNELSRLTYLNLEHCKLLESLPQLPFPTSIEWDLRKNKYSNKKGLLIFNCSGLCKTECCNSITFSWIIQFIQANQEHSFMLDRIDFVVPAKSEIPNWFNNQSVSGSIPIELSPFVHDNDDNIIGIACCAVFSIAPIDPAMTIYANANIYDIELSFSNKITCNGWCELFSCIPVILERDLITVKSDHMWLIHFTRDSFFDILKHIDLTLNHLDDFCMKVVDRNCKFLAIEDAAQPQSSSDYIIP